MSALATSWSLLPANLRGAGCVIAGGVLLILMASLVKHLGQTLPVYEVIFVRFVVGLVALLPVLWRIGPQVMRTTRFPLHLARGAVGFAGNLCFVFALVHLAIGDTVTIQFSRPLIMVVVASAFLGEVVGPRRGAATAAGFVGVLMITRPFGGAFEPWVLVAIAGAVFATLVVITVKALTRTESTMTIMFYFALLTTLFSAVPTIFVWQTPTWTELWLLILTGVLGILGQGLFTHGIGLGETTFVLPFDYLRIVYAFVVGAAFFAEMPDVWGVGGAAVIIGSSLYLVRSEQRRKAPNAGASA